MLRFGRLSGTSSTQLYNVCSSAWHGRGERGSGGAQVVSAAEESTGRERGRGERGSGLTSVSAGMLAETAAPFTVRRYSLVQFLRW